MIFKYKPAIAILCFSLIAGIAFSVEPGKRTKAAKSEDPFTEEAGELEFPNQTATKKTSGTATRKAAPHKLQDPVKPRKSPPPKAEKNPFDQSEEQDAFLNDLLSEEPPARNSEKTNKPRSRNAKPAKPDSGKQDSGKLIPRLKSEDDLTEASPFQKSTPIETSPLAEESSPEIKSVSRTSAESISSESSAALIPLANLAPDELLAPQVTLTWHLNEAVTLGRECRCQLIVRNPGQIIAQQVKVEARLGEAVKLTATEPQAIVRDSQLIWDLGNLQPESEVVLEVGLIPQQAGELPVSAIVKFGSGSVTRFQVEEPLLAVKTVANEEILSGETMNVVVTLLNPGTGPVKEARLEAELPEGVTHDGQSQLSLTVGEIPAGESRSIELPLTCTGRGERQFTVKAVGDLVPARESEVSWQVLGPDLQLEAAGPSRRFVSRPAQYKVSLTNRGTSAAEHVKIACVVPAGFKLRTIGQNGLYDEQSNTIVWNIEQIGAGETQELSVDATAQTVGQQIFLVRAQSDHGGEASATCETNVEGVTSVALNIQDLDDPVEVGTETGYELVIQNDGTQSLSEVEVICELPPEVEFLVGTGPTEVSAGEGVIRIARISELQPGQELSYQLKIRGTREGSARLSAKLTAAELSKPIQAGEVTRIYED